MSECESVVPKGNFEGLTAFIQQIIYGRFEQTSQSNVSCEARNLTASHSALLEQTMSLLVAKNLTKHVAYCQLNGENVVRIHRHVHASKSIITTLKYCTNYINCD